MTKILKYFLAIFLLCSCGNGTGSRTTYMYDDFDYAEDPKITELEEKVEELENKIEELEESMESAKTSIENAMIYLDDQLYQDAYDEMENAETYLNYD